MAFYISFSGYKKYKGCEFDYWNHYINDTKVDTPDDRLGSIYGSVVGELFEDFYEEKMWKLDQPQAHMLTLVDAKITKVINLEIVPRQVERRGVLKWKGTGVLLWKGDGEGESPWALYKNRDELTSDVRDAVEVGFRIIRVERLLGPRMAAEVKLDVKFPEGIIGGRADFIITRTKPHNDVCIIDGKGSRHRDRYVDPAQVMWYGMLYRHRNKRTPDKLAFLYWRYAPPESMDWVEFDDQDLDELLETVRATMRRITEQQEAAGSGAPYVRARKVFLPIAEKIGGQNAFNQGCRFCPFGTEEICPKGYAVKQKYGRRD